MGRLVDLICLSEDRGRGQTFGEFFQALCLLSGKLQLAHGGLWLSHRSSNRGVLAVTWDLPLIFASSLRPSVVSHSINDVSFYYLLSSVIYYAMYKRPTEQRKSAQSGKLYVRALTVAGVVSFSDSTIVPYWKGPLRTESTSNFRILLTRKKAHLLEDKQIPSVGVFSTWMTFGGNTRDLGSFGEETDEITDLHQILEDVLLTERGDGIACIKRHRRDPSSNGVKDLLMASGHGRLNEDLESST
ncbi:hypothetical protein Tco_1304070 [Tanacetum coccineum]